MSETEPVSNKSESELILHDGIEWVPWWAIWDSLDEMMDEMEDDFGDKMYFVP